MLESLTLCTVYSALLSGIPGVFFYYKLPNNKAKSLLTFIWLAFFIDFIGLYFNKWTGLVNFPIYNIYIFICFTYYIFLLKLLFTKFKNQRIASISLITYVFFYSFNFLFVQRNLASPFTYVYAVGVVIILVLSCLYLLEILNSEMILNFKRSIYFWFVLGILIFHVSFLPFMFASLFFLLENNDAILVYVLFALNLLMHSCFLIGFIWSEKRYNY
jgi:hypothetical protein